jgi:hypothetical protein
MSSLGASVRRSHRPQQQPGFKPYFYLLEFLQIVSGITHKKHNTYMKTLSTITKALQQRSNELFLTVVILSSLQFGHEIKVSCLGSFYDISSSVLDIRIYEAVANFSTSDIYLGN